MKTFKQYCEAAPTKISVYDNVIQQLKEEPFRFRQTHKNLPGIYMKRHLLYSSDDIDMWVNYGPIEPDQNTFIDAPCAYGSGIFASLSKPNIAKILTLAAIEHLSTDQYLTFGCKKYSYFIGYSDANVIIPPSFNAIKPFFEIYNIYIDTPGSEAEKTVAVAQFCGMNRGDFLRLKHKYGLIKSADELSDQDALDLF